MRPLLTLLTAVLLATTATADTGPRVPWRVESRRLPNGLTVAAIPFDSPGVVALFVGVRVGSRDEVDPGSSGFAHLFEHLMFRGTEARSESAWREQIQRLGADASAYTWDDQTVYYTVGAAGTLESLVDLEADRLRHLSYGEDVLRTEARAVLGEYLRGATDPWTRMLETLHATAFAVHPYAHVTMGHEEDIRAMPSRYAYSQAFRARYYVPSRVVLIAAGDVELPPLTAIAERALGDWAPPEGVELSPTPAPTPEPPQDGPRDAAVHWPAPASPRLLFGWRVPAFSADDGTSAALSVAAELAFGRSSALWRRLVIEEQVAEDVEVWSWPHRDPFLVMVAVRMRVPGATERVRRLVQEAADAVAEAAGGPWLEEAVPRARDHLLYEELLDVASARDLANRVTLFATVTGDPRTWERYLGRLEAVIPEDVARAAREHLSRRSRTTVALVPEAPGEAPPVAPAESRQSTGGAPAGDDAPAIEDAPDLRPAAAPMMAPAAPTALAPAAPAAPAALAPAAPAAPTALAPAVGPAATGPRPIPVIRIPAPGAGALDVRIQLRVGAADDPPGQEGITALTARVMGAGATAHRTWAELLDMLYPLGASIDVQVSREQVTFIGRCHVDHAARFVALLAELLTAPAFAQDDLDRARSEVRAQLIDGLRSGDDEGLAKAALDLALYAGHPYGHLDDGALAPLDALTTADLRAWRARAFTRDTVVVGLGGDGVEAAEAALLPALEALPPGPGVAPAVPPAPALPGVRAVLVERDAPATAISIGFPIDVVRDHPDFVPLLVATSWLGEHRQLHGRLFRRMRALRGLNYGDYAYLEHFEQDGHTIRPRTNVARSRQAFTLWIRPVSHAQRTFAVKLALWELARLAGRGLEQHELDATRDFLLGYTRVLEETVSRRLGYALDARHLGLPPLLEHVRAELPKVTVEQVRDAVRRHLAPRGLVIVAVTRDARAMARELLSPATTPSGAVDTSPGRGAEDAAIGALDVGLTRDSIRIVRAQDLFEAPGLPRGDRPR